MLLLVLVNFKASYLSVSYMSTAWSKWIEASNCVFYTDWINFSCTITECPAKVWCNTARHAWCM